MYGEMVCAVVNILLGVEPGGAAAAAMVWKTKITEDGDIKRRWKNEKFNMSACDIMRRRHSLVVFPLMARV